MMHEIPFYVQLGKRQRGWYLRPVLLRATQKRPEIAAPGAVVVRILVRIPDEAFEPLRPEAVIDVPLSLVQRPVLVEAQDASA
jgi:hypothetical protein